MPSLFQILFRSLKMRRAGLACCILVAALAGCAKEEEKETILDINMPGIDAKIQKSNDAVEVQVKRKDTEKQDEDDPQ